MKHTLHSRLTALALLVVVALAVVSSRAQTGHAATPRIDRLPFPACMHLHVPCAVSSGQRVK